MTRCALLVGPAPSTEASVLSARELALLGPRAVMKRRGDFLRGRWIAKQLLKAAYPGTTERDFEIIPDELGAPRAYGSALHEVPYAISISHTEGIAAAAVAESPARVGIDVERPIDKPDAIVGEYFTQEELHLCAGLSGAALQMRAALIWSVKETLMKVLGLGLRVAPTSVGLAGIGPTTGEWTACEVIGMAAGARVWMREGDGYVMTVGATVGDAPVLVRV